MGQLSKKRKDRTGCQCDKLNFPRSVVSLPTVGQGTFFRLHRIIGPELLGQIETHFRGMLDDEIVIVTNANLILIFGERFRRTEKIMFYNEFVNKQRFCRFNNYKVVEYVIYTL